MFQDVVAHHLMLCTRITNDMIDGAILDVEYATYAYDEPSYSQNDDRLFIIPLIKENS